MISLFMHLCFPSPVFRLFTVVMKSVRSTIIPIKMTRTSAQIPVICIVVNSVGRLLQTARLEHVRSEHSVFDTKASLRTIDTWDSSILAIVRENDEEKFIGIYNFSDQDKVAWINEDDGMYTDLISGHEMEGKGVMIPAFGCFWLRRKK